MTNTKLDFEQRQQAERMAENGDQLDQCFELVAARAEIARLQTSLKRYEPVSLYNGHDIDWWKAEAERLRALVGRMLPYVQRWDAASPAETQVQITLEDDAERALTAHAHEPCEQPAVCKGPPAGCPYIYCHSNLVCQYAVKSEGAPRGAGSPGLIQRVCHALTDNCVMFTDPERQPCTPENCKAVKASRGAGSEPRDGLSDKEREQRATLDARLAGVCVPNAALKRHFIGRHVRGWREVCWALICRTGA